jgi:hypothetical protein
MSKKAVQFLKKALGEDLLEALQKTELYKPDTRSVTSLEDIHLGLKLVPRTIMAMLVRELIPMQVSEHKDLYLPHSTEARIHIQKLGPDVYSGEMFEGVKKVGEFSHRPIPGVALVIMSNYELYDVEQEAQAPVIDHKEQEIQKIIEERLNLYELVNRVVDRKMERKDAIHALMLAKITDALNQPVMPPPPVIQPAPIVQEPAIEVLPEKKLPLKEFLDSRKMKLGKNEFFFAMEKSDKVHCDDCGKEIFNSSGFSGCICYGENMKSKVSIKKSEHGLKISFGRGWDPENIEMLLELLRGRRG